MILQLIYFSTQLSSSSSSSSFQLTDSMAERYCDATIRSSSDKITPLEWVIRLCRPKRVRRLPACSSRKDRLAVICRPRPWPQLHPLARRRKKAVRPIRSTSFDGFATEKETKSKRMWIKKFEQFELPKLWIVKPICDEVRRRNSPRSPKTMMEKKKAIDPPKLLNPSYLIWGATYNITINVGMHFRAFLLFIFIASECFVSSDLALLLGLP